MSFDNQTIKVEITNVKKKHFQDWLSSLPKSILWIYPGHLVDLPCKIYLVMYIYIMIKWRKIYAEIIIVTVKAKKSRTKS